MHPDLAVGQRAGVAHGVGEQLGGDHLGLVDELVGQVAGLQVVDHLAPDLADRGGLVGGAQGADDAVDARARGLGDDEAGSPVRWLPPSSWLSSWSRFEVTGRNLARPGHLAKHVTGTVGDDDVDAELEAAVDLARGVSTVQTYTWWPRRWKALTTLGRRSIRTSSPTASTPLGRMPSQVSAGIVASTR